MTIKLPETNSFFRFPRINKETLLPVATNDPYNPKDAWYPPGHGDFYTSLFDSGLLEEFKKAGKELVSQGWFKNGLGINWICVG